MDLLLLTAGAIVLIGITLWIVWPARTADPVGISVRGEEVSEHSMTEPNKPAPAPQGDRFADQYTSATADLSAGGVAAAIEGVHVAAEPPPTQRQSDLTPVPAAALAESHELRPRRSMGVRVGAVLAISGGVGGAWLYARWQRKRNKPINRLRRNAREMASRLGERIPDVDELPHGAAPMSGAATALLLTALVASRALRRDTDDPVEEVRDRAEILLRASAQEAMDRGRDAVKRGRKEAVEQASDALKRGRKEAMEQGRDALKRGRKEAMKQGREAVKRGKSEEARKPAIMGIGLGGMALVAGGAFVVWRILHRGQPDRSTWYAGE